MIGDILRFIGESPPEYVLAVWAFLVAIIVH